MEDLTANRYPSRRSPWMGAILWAPVVLLAGGGAMAWLGIVEVETKTRWMMLTLLAGIALLIYSLWNGIEYWIADDRLHLRVSFFRYKIPLDAIHRIERSGYPVAGIRAGLAFQGLRVRWGTGYQLFISPAEEEAFLREIKEKQPGIIVET